MHHKQPWGHYNPLESLMIGPVGGIAMCHTNCGNCTRLSLCSDLWQIRFHPVTQEVRVRASQFFGPKVCKRAIHYKMKIFSRLEGWRLRQTNWSFDKNFIQAEKYFFLIWKPWKVCTILFLVLFDFLSEFLLVFDSPLHWCVVNYLKFYIPTKPFHALQRNENNFFSPLGNVLNH